MVPRVVSYGFLPRLSAAVACACAVTACKRAPAGADGIDGGGVTAPPPLVASAPDAASLHARCKVDPGDGAATLRDLGDRRAVIVGEGVATTAGFAVGVVHTAATGRVALVAQLAGHQLSGEWVVARGAEIVGDAPPPKPLAGVTGAYAVYLLRASPDGGKEGSSSRRIALRSLGGAAPIASFPDHADESLSFDAALSNDKTTAALAWDDGASVSGSSRDASTGGITIAVVSLAGAAGAPVPRVVSGTTADVDGPRLEPRKSGGWWAAWTAHRAEGTLDAGARAAGSLIEAPAEDRAYSWIEVAILGADGAPSGEARRITSPTGHAASFDLAARASGELDVFVRDETQAREGEGGRILHVVLKPDGGDEASEAIVAAGVGRGSIDLLSPPAGNDRENATAWLAFSDPQDRSFGFPLGQNRSPLGSPSAEDALEGGRLLALAEGAGSQGGSAHFLAAFPGSDGALFREVTCTP